MRKIIGLILIMMFCIGCSAPENVSSSNWKFAMECFEMTDKHIQDGSHLTMYEKSKRDKLAEMINNPVEYDLTEEEYKLFCDVWELLDLQGMYAFNPSDLYKNKYNRLKQTLLRTYEIE